MDNHYLAIQQLEEIYKENRYANLEIVNFSKEMIFVNKAPWTLTLFILSQYH